MYCLVLFFYLQNLFSIKVTLSELGINHTNYNPIQNSHRHERLKNTN